MSDDTMIVHHQLKSGDLDLPQETRLRVGGPEPDRFLRLQSWRPVVELDEAVKIEVTGELEVDGEIVRLENWRPGLTDIPDADYRRLSFEGDSRSFVLLDWRVSMGEQLQFVIKATLAIVR